MMADMGGLAAKNAKFANYELPTTFALNLVLVLFASFMLNSKSLLDL